MLFASGSPAQPFAPYYQVRSAGLSVTLNRPGTAFGLSGRPFAKNPENLCTSSFFLQSLPGEQTDANRAPVTPEIDSVNYGRLALLGGLMAGSIVAIHLYQQAGWWRDNRAPFHFQEDLVYGRSVDKIGHFFGATAFTFVMRRALEGANLPPKKALWIGAGGALLFQTYVEVEDGFSAWGFDRVDWLSDLGGAAWPLLQDAVPSLQNYNLKFSYVPSDLLDRPGGSGFKGQKHLIIDDYEGQTFWLSVKMKKVLPACAANYWPSFLCLAAGYGARDIAGVGVSPYSVLFLTFDYDFAEIIPQSSTFLKDLTEALDFIHFPAPALRISPTAIWYGLYF